MVEDIRINTDYIKLDQFLKWAGSAENGAHAKDLIFSGEVTVNGVTARERGKKIRPGDIVRVNGIGEFKCI